MKKFVVALLLFGFSVCSLQAHDSVINKALSVVDKANLALCKSLSIYEQPKKHGAVPLDEKQYAHIHAAVEKLAQEMDIVKPELWVIHDKWVTGEDGIARCHFDTPVAFTNGAVLKSYVVIHDTLLKILNEQELEAVLAHELGHTKNRDKVFNTAYALLGGCVLEAYAICNIEKKPVQTVIITVLGLGSYIAGVFKASRLCEYAADITAAHYRDPRALASALSKLETMLQHPKKSWIKRLFATHPPMQDRIKALQAMA